MKSRSVLALMILGFLGGVLAGCEDGPAEKAGKKIDRAVDKLAGKKGPAEKAGERIDEAVEELKK